jgi:hypothetical protein
MYNINEMVSVMGKRKKMPTTLGINLKTGTILIAPERAQDGPSQEWTADRMSHYSREGKHVFLELVRPSKSIDFHAGAKDTAEEIVAALGEMAGAAKALGLREVIAAGTGAQQKQGQVLYDFMAQGDDEVTVAAGDEVIVLDDSNDEWWQVRRVKNGKQGVMPGSYVEVTGTVAMPAPSASIPPPHHTSRSTVEQNRLEEARLTREAVKAAQREEERERGKQQAEVGPGINLPDRTSSLSARDSGNKAGQQRSTRENGSSKSGKSSKSPTPLWCHHLTLARRQLTDSRTRSQQGPRLEGSIKLVQRGSAIHRTQGRQDQSTQGQWCEDRRPHCQDVTCGYRMGRSCHRPVSGRGEALIRSQKEGSSRSKQPLGQRQEGERTIIWQSRRFG